MDRGSLACMCVLYPPPPTLPPLDTLASYIVTLSSKRECFKQDGHYVAFYDLALEVLVYHLSYYIGQNNHKLSNQGEEP